MTNYEKLVVSAYTGTLMCDFNVLHQYIEATMGRPVFTHELADPDILKELKEKVEPEFLRICKTDEPCRSYLSAMVNPVSTPYLCNGSLLEKCEGCEFFHPHCDSKGEVTDETN